MATNTTLTTFTIPMDPAVTQLKTVEPLFVRVETIVHEANDTFTFSSRKIRSTNNTVKEPRVNATKTDIANFLSALSGQTVSASIIFDIKIFELDTSFLEVITT